MTGDAVTKSTDSGDFRTVVFVVTEDWYFVSHRLPMASAIRDLGYRVVVATRIRHEGPSIAAAGFEPRHVPFDRSSGNPLADARVIAALARLFRTEAPIVVHNVALRAILAGTIAARFRRVPAIVNTFTGLGTVLGDPEGDSAKRWLIRRALAMACRSRRVWTIVQNTDDRAALLTHGVAVSARTALIPGSGVDTQRITAAPEPAAPVTVLMVSRLLHAKGVGDLVAAARTITQARPDVRVLIAGDRDATNADSVSEAELASWQAERVVTFLGRRSDVADLWQQAHIAVQPSRYGEGVPKSLLEAAAAGRALVATDVAGCRDVVADGAGLCVPSRAPAALARAVLDLVDDADLRARYGARARRAACERFDAGVVAHAVSRLYGELDPRGAGGSASKPAYVAS